MIVAKDKYPELIRYEGRGVFTTKGMEFEAPFVITHFPSNTIIETKIPKHYSGPDLMFVQPELWRLDGEVENGKPIVAGNLLFFRLDGEMITLNSFKDLYFGSKELDGICRAEFPLVGLSKENFEVNIDEWTIRCNGEENKVSFSHDIQRIWQVPLEGKILTIEKKDQKQPQFLEKAICITNLLSLALANDVTFNRQLYYIQNELASEEWRRRESSNLGVERCIPDFCMDHFLVSTLSVFEKWDPQKRKLFFSTVDYINSSGTGYLEDRILRLSIAWEALADEWRIREKKKEDELKLLKKQLKEVITAFDFPDFYDKELVTNRVLDSLKRERNTEKLQQFAHQYRLDERKIGLNFDLLIKVRNDIAHSGLFRKKYDKHELLELLYSHKLGLQLILLIELKYDGLIEFKDDGWVSRIKLASLLTN